MNTDNGRLFYATGIDNSQLRSDAAESRNILAGIGRTAEQEGNRMDAAFGKIARAAGSIFAIGQITQFAKEIISVRGEIESLEISFETLAGKTKGDALFGQIRQFAVQTPMMMKDLAAGAQTMLAFNIEVEKVMPMLRAIGDISMGDAQKFNSLSLAFSQMSATGKLMGQDLLQMINAGFNPLSVISEKTGKSIGALKKEMEEGKISTQMVTDAFISATSAGGKFYGMLEKQSHGINGAISNLQGAVEDMMNELGESSQGIVTGAISGATYLVQHYEAVAEILAVIVGTYGVYKAAIITNEAMIQAATAAKGMAVKEAYDSEMAALSALIPQKEAEATSSLQQAEAAGHITKEKAAEVAMLRAEAKAQIEALAAAEAAAQARLVAAKAEVASGLRWEEEIKDKIKALEEESDALFANGDYIAYDAAQEEIAALKAELLEVQKMRETAAEGANTAATEMNAASHQKNAIATTEDSAATEINTAETAKNTGVTSALTIAKTKLSQIASKLGGIITKHPYALAAAGVAALSYGIYKLTTYQTEAEKAQKRLDEAVRESDGSIEAERIQIEVMFDRLRSAKEGTEAYNDAKQAIIDQYGNYLNGLNEEISTLKDVEGAYNAVSDAAMKAARYRAMNAYIASEGDEYATQRQEVYDQIYNLIKNKYGQAYADAHRQTINDVINGTKNWSQAFLAAFNETRTVSMGQYAAARSYNYNALQSYTTRARQGEANYKNTLENAYSRFGLSPDQQQEAPKQGTPVVKDKAYWEQKKKEAEAELAALTDIEAAGTKGEAIKRRISNIQKRIDGFSVSSQSAVNKADQNRARIIAAQGEIAEYTDAVIDAVKQSEFDQEQARIDAMDEGLERTLAQNALNYSRLKEQNRMRAEQMVADLRDTMQKQWEVDNPNATETQKEQHRADLLQQVTAENFDPTKLPEQFREQGKQILAMIATYSDLATQSYNQANSEALRAALSDVQTYLQQRKKIEEDYAKREEALYTHDANGNRTGLVEGVTQGNVDELQRQRDEALASIDEHFASREAGFQAWCNAIGELSLKQLRAVLGKARAELEALEALGDDAPAQELAVARAKVDAATKAVNDAEAKDKLDPGARTIKEWQDLYGTLNEVRGAFEDIGDTVGGVIGDIISECGKMAASTLSMINGIVQLVNMSKTGIEGTAAAGANAISTMEKASVILSIISAGMQIAMQIANLFNNDDKKQKEIDALQNRIDQLQWELDNQEVGRVQEQYGTAIERLNKALAQTRDELAAGQNGWQRIVTLTSRASRNQELMQRTAEKLAQTYGSMSYTADKALGAEKYQQANEQLKSIAQQQILIQEQINAEVSKKDSDNGKIQDWQNKIEELGQEAIELINEMVEDIIGDTSSGIAEELADAFIEAFRAGEDAAKAWGDKVNDIVADILKRMLVSKFLEEPLGEIFDKYKAKWFKDGQFQGLDSVINSMQEFAGDLNAVGADFADIWANLPDSVKNMLTITADAEREASQGGIATASQESVDELNGRATAIQSHTLSISENTKTILSTTQAILQSVMNIESETNGLGPRIEKMESNIRQMSNTLDDIANKGIRLRN